MSCSTGCEAAGGILVPVSGNRGVGISVCGLVCVTSALVTVSFL